MMKRIMAQPKKLTLVIKILAIAQLFLYVRHVYVLIQLSDPRNDVEFLSGILEYYIFIFLGVINIILVLIYIFKVNKNKLRYDRTVVSLVVTLIALSIAYFIVMLLRY
jgi:hypothetical protein